MAQKITNNGKMESFDPKKLGLPSHYSVEQRNRIQRYIAQDFYDLGEKAPRYTDQLAKYIEAEGVPGSSRDRLKRQTLVKIIQNSSNPHYEVWACLHVYLRKKYSGQFKIDRDTSELEKIGQSLSVISKCEDLHETPIFAITSKDFVGYDDIEVALIIKETPNLNYGLVYAVAYKKNQNAEDTPLAALKGTCVLTSHRYVGIICHYESGNLIAIDNKWIGAPTLKRLSVSKKIEEMLQRLVKADV